MFIHIGNNIIISEKECIGIFNTETLKLGSDNEFFLKNIKADDKVISVNVNNEIKSSWVSPFTVIKREAINEDELIWSRKND
jgi:hypothetical protein